MQIHILPMGLHQLVGGSTGLGYRLLHFHLRDIIFDCPKKPSFYLGLVLPCNDVFTSDGAPLVICEFALLLITGLMVTTVKENHTGIH